MALSHAINRDEINEVIYVGQTIPYQGGPRPTSPYYNERLATQYLEYDPDLANEILDGIYPEKDSDGYRLGPDGERISFSVDTTTVNVEWTDMLELIQGYWTAVGIDMQVNVIDRSLLYDRKEANQHDAVVWAGGGGLEAPLEMRFYLPFSAESNYAELWQQYYNGDPRGEAPPEGHPVYRQWELYDLVKATPDPVKQAEYMAEIMEIAADQFYVIGTLLTPPSYGIVKTNMVNVPEIMPGSWLYPNPAPTNPFTYAFSS